MSRRLSDRLGMPLLGVVGLAALAAPRVVAHDLDLVSPAVNSVLVFAPLLAWIGVVWWRRVPNPFVTLLAVGVVYGVMLAVIHQLLWSRSFDGAPPELGGNLAGVLAPAVESGVIRVFAFGGSLVTGTLVGAATGAVAWLLAKATRRGTGPE
ncbi:hypothetical protein LX16_2674 [Stackebrandtia albiflava]|uniref:Uncharacterized protein n=1 Tax=Stackebrandtia albiflava TaxID=406432 RepID=A0A562V286_9ACTN|nr:hypothetical protein [Stackebrandtia albiflava]TWJ11932.1 hypothetical protein LX16_2674 [Stackebrandtia albiflava]